MADNKAFPYTVLFWLIIHLPSNWSKPVKDSKNDERYALFGMQHSCCIFLRSLCIVRTCGCLFFMAMFLCENKHKCPMQLKKPDSYKELMHFSEVVSPISTHTNCTADLLFTIFQWMNRNTVILLHHIVFCGFTMMPELLKCSKYVCIPHTLYQNVWKYSNWKCIYHNHNTANIGPLLVHWPMIYPILETTALSKVVLFT